jgi:hypothetical protein
VQPLHPSELLLSGGQSGQILDVSLFCVSPNLGENMLPSLSDRHQVAFYPAFFLTLFLAFYYPTYILSFYLRYIIAGGALSDTLAYSV